jgi:peptide/nickel transport system substrate-binding protein
MGYLISKPAARVVTAMTACALLLAACGSSSSAGKTPGSTTGRANGGSTTLRVAFQADMGAPDPDVFYATEGLMVTTNVYDGLLRYANNSTTIEPDLASLPTVSADKVTYTFHLHPQVLFHDGTAFNAKAVAFSFARRIKINQGPAYMLAHVKRLDLPNPLTVVVHLNQPVSAFLDYLASPFGPKMMSPTAITAQTVKGDEAQGWLQTHDAGSGPYEITSWKTNQGYVLSRFAKYWGPAPPIPEVDISILPDISTQQLELRSGQLDMITHGLDTQALDGFAHSSTFSVHTYPTELKAILFVNPHRGPFVTQKAREALEQAIDKATITSRVFGPYGVASTQIYPAGELPPSVTTSTVRYDTSALKALVPALPNKSVDIGYDSTDPRNSLVAELLQLELQGIGLQATDRAIPVAQIFTLSAHPNDAPTILIQTTNPDAAHPDTWARIYMGSQGGANYLACADPAVDSALNAGLAASSTTAEQAGYGAAGNEIVKNGCFIDIADVQDTIVSKSNLNGLGHVPSIPWSFYLDGLRFG